MARKSSDSGRFKDIIFTGPVVTGPLPKIEFETFTPPLAWSAYGTRLKGHRGPVDLTVHQIKDAAQQGNWMPGDVARFNKSGNLVDGGSMMFAISQMPAGSEVTVPVQRDMPDDWTPSEDVIKSKRHWGHSLNYVHTDETSTKLRVAASIANMLYGYDGPGSLPDFRRKLWTKHEMFDFFEPMADTLIKAAGLGQTYSNLDQKNIPGAITTAETLGMVLWLLKDEKDAPAFFAAMCRRDAQMMANPNDPRTQFVIHFRRPVNDLGIHRYRNSYAVRLQRVAELLGLWHAHKAGIAWTPWNGMENGFRHVTLSLADQKLLGWV